ncbi:MAG: hypothetical protein AAB834_05290, partial [Patescibacteria group bacterium]
DAGHLYIGKDNSAAAFPAYKGLIDALAIYNEIIDATEAAANFDKGDPYNYNMITTGQDPGIPNNQYGQYKAFLFTDGSAGPLTQSISMINNTYVTDDPTIDSAAATGISFSSTDQFDSFTLTPGSVTTGTVKFAFQCANGTGTCSDTNWKYHNGTSWVNSTNYSTANATGDLTQARLNAFDEATITSGINKILWRAYLHSATGEEQYEMNNINISTTGGGGTITVSEPNGTKVWKDETSTYTDDTAAVIKWTFTGGVTTVDVRFDKDGDFNAGDTGNDLDFAVATGISSTASAGCTPPGGGGCYVWSAGPDENRLSTNAKIRVLEGAVTGDSNPFEVRGWYNLTAPTGASVWRVEETNKSITWDTHGTGLGNVDLEYYRTSTSSWVAIAGYQNQADVDGAHSHTWASVVDDGCATLNTTGGGG